MPCRSQPQYPTTIARRLAAGGMSAVIATVMMATSMAAGLGGCYRPTPVVHVELRVPEQGDFVLDGAAVPGGQLRDRLAATKTAKAVHGDLLVTIELSPAASGERMHQAVEAVKQAQARVAFGAHAQALKAAPSASGVPAD